MFVKTLVPDVEVTADKVSKVLAARIEPAAIVPRPVPPAATAMSVALHVPVVIVPTEAKDDNVVTAVLTKVPDVGKVTLVAPVAVRVIE